MRIFVAGASGAIGRRLVPLLVSSNHEVVASTRTANKALALERQGAEAVVVDGLDRDAVVKAVAAARPDVIVHQMTALASVRSLRNFDKEFAVTNRLRTEGTEALIAGAHAAGTKRVIVQSYSGWPYSREGSRVKTEADPLDATPPKKMSQSLAAIRRLEDLAMHAEGITGTVLRYGSLYGPGTSIARNGEIVKLVRKRGFPVMGDGAGVWSFLHVDDAAKATWMAIESEASGLFNVVDDEPAAVSVWVPELARILGAPAPPHIPAWLGKLAMGESGLSMMTKSRGASNAKARRELGWRPAFGSWREGFPVAVESD